MCQEIDVENEFEQALIQHCAYEKGDAKSYAAGSMARAIRPQQAMSAPSTCGAAYSRGIA